MSAPNAGRQSPDPERQTGAQQQDVPASGKADVASDTHAKDKSEDHKQNTLESNPKGPLDDAADAKISKDGRGGLYIKPTKSLKNTAYARRSQ
ncbi:MAG: hypothetical protein M1833_003946 [Piccolia ochrophora]|nr:MAG: hypothetical protein M1833_003946 [Piccolia ochrophora]